MGLLEFKELFKIRISYVQHFFTLYWQISSNYLLHRKRMQL